MYLNVYTLVLQIPSEKVFRPLYKPFQLQSLKRFGSLGLHYPLVNKHNYGKSPFLIRKSTINGYKLQCIYIYPWYSTYPTLGRSKNHNAGSLFWSAALQVPTSRLPRWEASGFKSGDSPKPSARTSWRSKRVSLDWAIERGLHRILRRIEWDVLYRYILCIYI